MSLYCFIKEKKKLKSLYTKSKGQRTNENLRPNNSILFSIRNMHARWEMYRDERFHSRIDIRSEMTIRQPLFTLRSTNSRSIGHNFLITLEFTGTLITIHIALRCSPFVHNDFYSVHIHLRASKILRTERKRM